jgi:uncharacterized membrane protein YphA (DoxX/SURF4 family)
LHAEEEKTARLSVSRRLVRLVHEGRTVGAGRNRKDTTMKPILSTQPSMATLNATVAADRSSQRAPRAFVHHLPLVGRLLLGLVFFVFGLDGLVHFMPQPTGPFPEKAMAFGNAMMQTGYLFQLLKGTEVLAGALLLSNRFVPLALVLLAPVLVNILAFHLFLEPAGAPLAVVLVALAAALAWSHRGAYRALLVARSTPGGR